MQILKTSTQNKSIFEIIHTYKIKNQRFLLLVNDILQVQNFFLLYIIISLNMNELYFYSTSYCKIILKFNIYFYLYVCAYIYMTIFTFHWKCYYDSGWKVTATATCHSTEHCQRLQTGYITILPSQRNFSVLLSQ